VRLRLQQTPSRQRQACQRHLPAAHLSSSLLPCVRYGEVYLLNGPGGGGSRFRSLVVVEQCSSEEGPTRGHGDLEQRVLLEDGLVSE
jgi:hypothetical protein